MNKINKWVPTESPKIIRRLGKLNEECGELIKISSRCLIQGIDGKDPTNGTLNLEELFKELADVQAQIDCTIELFQFDKIRLLTRSEIKIKQMHEWESFFLEEK